MAPQTRRELLRLGIAGMVGAAAQLLGGPPPTLATTGNPVLLGTDNGADATTTVYSSSANGLAVIGGPFSVGAAVSGRLRDTGQETVSIPSDWSIGVYGGVPMAIPLSVGVHGYGGTGVWGKAEGSQGTGVIGEGGVGVTGRTLSTRGTGVYGEATQPNAVAISAIGKNGATALAVSGRATFSRSGTVTIAKGSSTTNVPAPLGATTLVFATIQSGATGIHLRASKPTVSTQRITFYLNAKAPSPITIAWMVIN